MLNKSKINRRYGWRPQLKKATHLKYGLVCSNEVIPIEQLPPSVDLRPQDSPIEDQGPLGSCTANAICGNIQFIQKCPPLSRLFLYFNERYTEGTQDTDSGAEISDGIMSVTTTGIIPETEWPYDVSQFTVQPPQTCYDDAKKDVLIQYLQISGEKEMKSCLAQGFPYVFGFTVYESFESSQVASTGIVPEPQSGEQVLGGHAVMALGYTLPINGIIYYIVRNSWGTGWGQEGYFLMPSKMMVSLADDWTTIRK